MGWKMCSCCAKWERSPVSNPGWSEKSGVTPNLEEPVEALVVVDCGRPISDCFPGDTNTSGGAPSGDSSGIRTGGGGCQVPSERAPLACDLLAPLPSSNSSPSSSPPTFATTDTVESLEEARRAVSTIATAPWPPNATPSAMRCLLAAAAKGNTLSQEMAANVITGHKTGASWTLMSVTSSESSSLGLYKQGQRPVGHGTPSSSTLPVQESQKDMTAGSLSKRSQQAPPVPMVLQHRKGSPA
mmetsp:Transcript_56354/g.123735  ORF Transcript_56354/g.123735 Transcript_56354/m.123735 type:complete len:242 (-) Transcript_56354:472-1197(-)